MMMTMMVVVVVGRRLDLHYSCWLVCSFHHTCLFPFSIWLCDLLLLLLLFVGLCDWVVVVKRKKDRRLDTLGKNLGKLELKDVNKYKCCIVVQVP